MEFVDATLPVLSRDSGNGPNPFANIIAGIALKTDVKGKPLAKSTIVEFDDKANEDARAALINRYKRQVRDAARDNDPVCTGRTHVEPVLNPVNKQPAKNKVRFIIWTTPKISRPRTPIQTPEASETDTSGDNED